MQKETYNPNVTNLINCLKSFKFKKIKFIKLDIKKNRKIKGLNPLFKS